MGIINWQKPSWIWFIQLTAGFGGLLFALSCAVNRVQSHTTSANRSGIESGRLKGHEIACTPQKTRHPLSTGRSVRSKHMARYPYPVVSFRIRVRDGNSRSHHAKHDLLSVRSSNERIFPGFSNSQNIVKPEDPPKMADANSLFTFDRPGISLTYGVFLDNEGNFGIPGHSAPNPDGADCRRTRDQDLSNDPESFQVKETQSPFGVDIPEITRSQAVRPSGHEQRQSRPFSKTERSFFLLTRLPQYFT